MTFSAKALAICKHQTTQYIYFFSVIMYLLYRVTSKEQLMFPTELMQMLLVMHILLFAVKLYDPVKFDKIVFGKKVPTYYQDIHTLEHKTNPKIKTKLEKIEDIILHSHHQRRPQSKRMENQLKYTSALSQQYQFKQSETKNQIFNQQKPNFNRQSYMRSSNRFVEEVKDEWQREEDQKLPEYTTHPQPYQPELVNQKLVLPLLKTIRAYFDNQIQKTKEKSDMKKQEINRILELIFGYKLNQRTIENGNLITIEGLQYLTQTYKKYGSIRNDIYGKIKLAHNKELFHEKMLKLGQLIANLPRKQINYQQRKEKFKFYLAHTQKILSNQKFKVVYNSHIIQNNSNTNYILDCNDYYNLYPMKLSKTKFNLQEVFYFIFQKVRKYPQYSNLEIMKQIKKITAIRF